MINILVTGSNGQLGNAIKELENEYSSYHLIFTDKKELDISKFDEVQEFVLKNKIQVIINCAAYTNVDKAEDELDLANEINYLAVENLGFVAKKNGIKLIHISTDYVFDGSSEIPYVENDKTNPKNNYGFTKLKGEEALIAINPENSIIIRTSWLYSLYGHNFVKTMLKLFKEKEVISVVSDQIGSPTNADDLAKVILQIIPAIKNKGIEIYHFANEGKCSWFEFAQEILKNSDANCKIAPISSKEFKSKALRPKYSLLNTEKIKKTFKIEILNWKESLKRCLIKTEEI
ncbi:dTDP-4-dehydrorhamnose reductase [Lutibacter flavus]|uniref:dTDP-4-dehydrorhamnose reductase n=1 Tax=Lutibacter flavus TaxID=691689 RepID=A0A238YXC6_9FLAO|nr:dTDP-4-dehydrorhamnose reductase [Lutibacter flavus]SNR75757.1 dTDP-4-dehydrorhamnose reductase [Lutibacter flavus]